MRSIQSYLMLWAEPGATGMRRMQGKRMLRYDHPSRQRDTLEQRQALLDTIVDYRFLAPHKIAAAERRQREMARSPLASEDSDSPSVPRRQMRDALRYRVGTMLIAAGVRLRGANAVALDLRPRT